MDDYDTFPRNSAKRIFDIEYSTKSSTKFQAPILKNEWVIFFISDFEVIMETEVKIDVRF